MIKVKLFIICFSILAGTFITHSLALAAHFGTSPFDPPKPSDVMFFTDQAPGLDTGCSYRSAGPLVFTIKSDRYVGEVNADGTLKDPAGLVSNGVISKTATLRLPGYDVDDLATPPRPYLPERDELYFNGRFVGTLKGLNNSWIQNTFEIPIEYVKFPDRGQNGSKPTPAENEIRIRIDTLNSYEVWCTSVDWATLSFKAVSPVILIHGNNSNGGFFDRRGFSGALKSAAIPYDNSINLTNGPIKSNGATLNARIPNIVKSFGTDSAHLVVHSKGGLDTREYLASYQPTHDKDFKILSYTSLSTPHNGSVGADLLMERQRAVNAQAEIKYSGFPIFTATVAAQMSPDAGTPHLTTSSTASFNSTNISKLPEGVVYNTVAADADTNGNEEIDRSPDEYADLRAESPQLTNLDNENFGHTKTRIAIDTAYQILRNTAGVTLTFRTEKSFWTGKTRTVATLTSNPTQAALGNDVLVTVPSGLGTGTFASRVKNRAAFTGAQGRNHSNVADAGVGSTVVPWIISVEKTSGDLR